jgi:hypothetical protein
VAVIAHLALQKAGRGFYETSIRFLENFEAATSHGATPHPRALVGCLARIIGFVLFRNPGN